MSDEFVGPPRRIVKKGRPDAKPLSADEALRSRTDSTPGSMEDYRRRCAEMVENAPKYIGSEAEFGRHIRNEALDVLAQINELKALAAVGAERKPEEQARFLELRELLRPAGKSSPYQDIRDLILGVDGEVGPPVPEPDPIMMEEFFPAEPVPEQPGEMQAQCSQMRDPYNEVHCQLNPNPRPKESKEDIVSKLRELKSLLDDGILEPDEFRAKKTELLARL